MSDEQERSEIDRDDLDEALKSRDKISDLNLRLVKLEHVDEESPWQKWRWRAASGLLVFVGMLIFQDDRGRITANAEGVSANRDRIAAVESRGVGAPALDPQRVMRLEQKLKAPRFNASDGLVAIDCHQKVTEAAIQLLMEHAAGRTGRELPVILRQLEACRPKIEALEADLRRRRNGK